MRNGLPNNAVPPVRIILIAQVLQKRRCIQDAIHRASVNVQLPGDILGFQSGALTDRRAYFSFCLFSNHFSTAFISSFCHYYTRLRTLCKGILSGWFSPFSNTASQLRHVAPQRVFGGDLKIYPRKNISRHRANVAALWKKARLQIYLFSDYIE